MDWKQRGAEFKFSALLQLSHILISEHLTMQCHHCVKVLLLLMFISLSFPVRVQNKQSACYLTCYLSILLALFSDPVLSSSVFIPMWLSAVQNIWPWTGKHPGGEECQKWYKQQQRTSLACLKCYEYLQIKYQVYLHCSNALMVFASVSKVASLKKTLSLHLESTGACPERRY